MVESCRFKQWNRRRMYTYFRDVIYQWRNVCLHGGRGEDRQEYEELPKEGDGQRRITIFHDYKLKN